MSERQITELLRRMPVPAEREAEERAWRVVQAAFEQRVPAPRRRRSNRLAIAVAIGILALALALTPAGAKVADLVHDVVHPGEKNARPELTSLPTSGRLLVTSPTGAWVGAAFIVLTGLLVIALLVEALPHRPGWLNRLKRLAIAIAVGIVVGTLTFGAAFLGLYLSCPFF